MKKSALNDPASLSLTIDFNTPRLLITFRLFDVADDLVQGSFGDPSRHID